MHMQATAILLLQLLLPPASSSWHSCSCCCCYWLLQVLLLPLLLLLSNQSASKSQTLTYNPIHGFKLTYLPAQRLRRAASQPRSRRVVDNGGGSGFRVPDSGFALRAAAFPTWTLTHPAPAHSPALNWAIRQIIELSPAGHSNGLQPHQRSEGQSPFQGGAQTLCRSSQGVELPRGSNFGPRVRARCLAIKASYLTSE